MGKWTKKTKINARVRKQITWWKKQLATAKAQLKIDKANPRYDPSSIRNSGGIKVQETRITAIEKAIMQLQNNLK